MRTYLSESERRRRYLVFRIKLYATGAVLVFLTTGGVYAIRNSGLFEVRDVWVVGLNASGEILLRRELQEEILENSRTRFLGAMNYFSWPDTLDTFSVHYQNVAIKKNLLARTITVTATPWDRFAAWCGVREIGCYWIDSAEGVFLDATPKPAGQLVATVIEETDIVPVPGQTLLPADKFMRLKQIIRYVHDAALPINVLFLDRELDEVWVDTVHGARIRFSIRFDPALNLAGLDEMLRTVPIERIRELDLTVPGKVYLTRK